MAGISGPIVARRLQHPLYPVEITANPDLKDAEPNDIQEQDDKNHAIRRHDQRTAGDIFGLGPGDGAKRRRPTRAGILLDRIFELLSDRRRDQPA